LIKHRIWRRRLRRNREGFVHDQISASAWRRRQSKPRRHAARIEFDRLIKEIADMAKAAIAVSLASTVERRMPIWRRRSKHFPARQLMVEPAPSARIGATAH